MPDQKVLPELCYLPTDKTPTITSSGSQWDADDYRPRAQMKKKFEDGTLALDDTESIAMFSKTFAVEESLSRKYLEHFEYIQLKKEKRSEERKRQKTTTRSHENL